MSSRIYLFVVWFVCALGLLGCKERTAEGSGVPSANQPPPLAAGFTRVEVEGWSIDVPSSYEAGPPDRPESRTVWLVHRVGKKEPGSPRVLLGRHRKPAEYPSRVFGLMVIEGLNKAENKRVINSRQHEVQGLEVTDIEAQIGTSTSTRVHWRRLFVHNGFAYSLTYSVDEAHASAHRERAARVRESLTLATKSHH